MGVDYMTRQAEGITTTTVMANKVAKFVYENFCCHFGVLLEIQSIRGTHFREKIIGELMRNLGTTCCHSTPYYRIEREHV